VARTFAGALGLIAWITTLVVGWTSGGGIEQVLFRAWCWLWVYAVIGALAGHAASWIVDDAIRKRIGDELAAAEAARSKAAEAK
jgi:hypothetical protein